MPTLSTPAVNVTVRQGEDAILTCTPSVDSVILEWRFSRFGDFLAFDCVDEYCHMISISSAAFYNEGDYLCLVAGDQGFGEIEGDSFYVVEPVTIRLTVLESKRTFSL